jgi:hypothetical protein
MSSSNDDNNNNTSNAAVEDAFELSWVLGVILPTNAAAKERRAWHS